MAPIPERLFQSPLANRLLYLAVLFSLLFLLATVEVRGQGTGHNDAFADATAITLGVTVTEAIQFPRDADYFRFEIPDTTVAKDVWIYTTGPTDTVGQLFDSTLSLAASNDDSVLGSMPRNFQMGANLGPGVYYIEVQGYETATGTYSLHTKTGADQGRRIAEAASLAIGVPVDGIIGPAGDIDLFEIDLSAKTKASDLVMYTSGNVDTIGVLFDYRGVRLEANGYSPLSDGARDFFIGRTLGPGVYYLAVVGYGEGVGPYRLYVEEMVDQNGSRAGAATLAIDDSAYGFIDSGGDEDYFRLTLTTATDVWIYAIGDTDTVGELLDSNGTRLAFNDDSVFSVGRLSFFTAKNLSAGTYYVNVSGFAAKTGPYRLYAEAVADQSNDTSTAEELVLGVPKIGLIDPVSGTPPNRTADEDLLKLELDTAAEVLVYTTGEVDTTGELLDSDGATALGLDDDRGDGKNFLIRKELEAGTYYIRVKGYQSGARPETGPYAVFAEPVKSLGFAGIASGVIAQGFDEEHYKLTLSSASDVWVYASASPVTDVVMDTVGTLYDGSFNEIAQNDDSGIVGRDGAFHIRETLEAGTYYVRVGSFGTRTGGFALSAETVIDPGGSIAAATSLSLGSPSAGTIDPANDADYFRLYLGKHTNLYLYGRSTDDSFVYGEVLGGRGNRISVNERVLPDGFGIRDDFSSGVYYVRVIADGTAKYTVHVLEDTAYTDFVNDCEQQTGELGGGFTDDLYACQWHLKNRDNEGEDINVQPVWEEGVTGAGVKIAVVDDGMDHYHEDLAVNVNKNLNHDYTVNGDVRGSFQHHGTAVAGLIAARDNDIGVRGVAPRATIYGYNLLTGPISLNQLDAMSRNPGVTAISSNSWGGVDDPGLVQVTALWEAVVKTGVEKGYGGKGTFYVWAAGNGGDNGDNSNLEEYSNYYAITPVCAVNDDGIRSYYSEEGANLWVCAPSNDLRPGHQGIVTIENSDRYRYTFGGTSASTPIVSGVAALIRQVNPEVTWRDLKLILANTARKNDERNIGWEDGAFKHGSDTEKYHFNHEYGFGVVDAKAAVDLARHWTNLPPLKSGEVASGSLNARIPDLSSTGNPTTVTRTLYLNTDIEFTEFVEIKVSFQHSSFRDLEIELESPSGAVSKLVDPYETSSPIPLYGEFRFGSAKHLGENPNGQWKLRITDRISGVTGSMNSWTIKVYGHELTPAAPTLDSLTAGEDSLTVVWSAPAVARGSSPTSYDLRSIPAEADETVEANWTIVEGIWRTGGGNLNYELTGLAGGSQYDVQVRGVNTAGAGAWSKTLTGSPTVGTRDCSNGGTLTTLAGSPELVTDCDALLSLRDDLAGPTALNWAVSLTLDKWDGVTLGGNPRRVVKLELGGKGLAGQIPSGLGSLTGLGELDLSDNDLTGSIPSELGSLTGLMELRLNKNGLTGRIPTELGSLTGLTVLDLSENNLTGNMPSELGSLNQLVKLYLEQNRFTGEIPSWLGSLQALEELYISQNGFTGCIPKELRNLTDHDLAVVGLPFCDVLLSGLSISPGTLIPQFDPYRTEYTAEATASRTTFTATNDNGATVGFLDVNGTALADADGASAGHQLDLAEGDTTIKVKVVSQDQAADHTYTIVVTLDDVVSRYDRDGDGVISKDEAITAVIDYFNGIITKEDAITVIIAYFSS